MNKPIMTVSQLNTMLKSLIENAAVLQNLYVRGEISNLTFNRSGHIYFSLKDEKASLKCMIWRDRVKQFRDLNLKEGMAVTCLGRLTYYILGGSLGLEIANLTLEGKGELQKLYDQRFNKLQAEGWFDESLKQNLPKFPKNIGIVTADTGAVIHDLVSTIRRRYPLTSIYLFPTQVQGPQAANNIAEKITQANRFTEPLDVLIVGRGGGSYEDLWSFNELVVLSAIRQSIIPIVSAVGHEPDFTLADYVADKRAATPTAAAELVTPNLRELQQNLSWHYQEWIRLIDQLFITNEQWLTKANYFLSNHLNQNLNRKLIELKSLYQTNRERINLQLLLRSNFLEQLALQWQLASPFEILNKGYVLIYNQKQELILDMKQLTFGEKINLKTKNGVVEAQVRRILEKGK